MKSKRILLFDAIIGATFGISLLILPESLANFLGVPYTTNHFYTSLLGATFIGISIALMVEYFRKNNTRVGLGYTGAAAIDLTLGITLGFWLLFGNLEIPLRGQVFLGVLAIFLVGISITEYFSFKN